MEKDQVEEVTYDVSFTLWQAFCYWMALEVVHSVNSG